MGDESRRRGDPTTMSRWDAYRALCLARFREFYRESEVVFWSFIFPIVLAVALGVAFRDRPPETLAVAVVEGPASGAVAAALARAPFLRVRTAPEAEAMADLRRGKAAVVVAPAAGGAVEYRLDPSRPESVLARARADDALQRAAGRRDPLESRALEVTEPGGRYIDFLIPGIIGMNLMSGGMWGVGFNLVDMRIKRLLKRLIATPMRRADFLAAQMTNRAAFMFIELGFLLAFGRLVFGLPVRGSLGVVLLIALAGALSFGGLGLLVGCRTRRIETVTGLMNVAMMPMFVCSGIFFSYERFPEAVQPFIRALPLTALNDALRAVILEGEPLVSQAGRLLVLGLWGGSSFILGLRLFRWT